MSEGQKEEVEAEAQPDTGQELGQAHTQDLGVAELDQNLLLSFENAMWLKKLDSKFPAYKVLLPSVEITRSRGLTHDITATLPGMRANRRFFGMSTIGEGTLTLNDVELSSTPTIRPTGMLAALRLAYIFQTQGEYTTAVSYIKQLPYDIFIPKKSVLAEDAEGITEEKALFRTMTSWLDAGHELNGLAAVVIVWLLAHLGNYPLEKKQLEKIIVQYMLGFDMYSRALTLNHREEMLLWSTLGVCKDRMDDLQALVNPTEVVCLSDRVTTLLNRVRSWDRSTRQRNNLYGYYKESQVLRESDYGWLRRGSLAEIQNHRLFHAEHEPLVYNCVLRLRENFFEKPNFDGSASLSVSRDELSIVFQSGKKLDLADEAEISPQLKTIKRDYETDKVMGVQKLDNIRNNPVLKDEMTEEELNDLTACVKSEQALASRDAVEAQSQVMRIGNTGRLTTMYAEDTWEALRMEDALRAYGIFVSTIRPISSSNYSSLSSFSSSSSSSLESDIVEFETLPVLLFLQSRFPWFSGDRLEKRLRDFLTSLERYITNVNSKQFLLRVLDALGRVSSAPTPEKRTEQWQLLVPLLWQVISGRSNSGNPDDPKNDHQLMYSTYLFECVSGLRPMEGQLEKMKFIFQSIRVRNAGLKKSKRKASPSVFLEQDSNLGVLIQQIMGSGKTKVLLPFLITVLLNHGGGDIPFVVNHISQHPSALLELPLVLSGFGIHLEVLTMSFERFSDPRTIDELFQRLCIVQEERMSVPTISSDVLLAMKTAYRVLSEKSKSGNEKLKKDLYIGFRRLFTFLESYGIAMLDEVHLTLNCRESHIIRPNTAKEVEIDKADVAYIVEVIYTLPATLLERIRNNTQDQMTTIEVRETLLKYVEDHHSTFNVDPALRKDFAKFVCGFYDGRMDSDAKMCMETYVLGNHVDVVHRANLLRKLFSVLLPSCLSKTYGEHYGYDSTGDIVPYRNRQPTNNHYKDPYEVLCYFTLATIIQGIAPVAMREWVQEKATKGVEEMTGGKQMSGKPFENTITSQFFLSLFNGEDDVSGPSNGRSNGQNGTPLTLVSVVRFVSGVSPVFKEDMMRPLLFYLETHPGKKKRFVSEIIQKYACYYRQSYCTTPIELPNMFAGTISMSGTLYNRQGYNEKVYTSWDPQEGSLGQVGVKLEEDERAGRTTVITLEKVKTIPQTRASRQQTQTRARALTQTQAQLHMQEGQGQGGARLGTVGGCLHQWKEKTKVTKDGQKKIESLRIIVDYGALFKDQPVLEAVFELARFIRENHIGANYIEFFDPVLDGRTVVRVDYVLKQGAQGFAASPSTDTSPYPTLEEIIQAENGAVFSLNRLLDETEARELNGETRFSPSSSLQANRLASSAATTLPPLPVDPDILSARVLSDPIAADAVLRRGADSGAGSGAGSDAGAKVETSAEAVVGAGSSAGVGAGTGTAMTMGRGIGVETDEGTGGRGRAPVKKDRLFLTRKMVNAEADRPKDKRELFTFLDSPRSTGTDPYLMYGAHGLVTLDLFQNDLEGLLQAVMRERQFLNSPDAGGQTMDILVSAEACRKLYPSFDTRTVKIPLQSPQWPSLHQQQQAEGQQPGRGERQGREQALPVIRLRDPLMLRLIRNSAKNISQQRQLAVSLITEEFPRRFVEERIRKAMTNTSFTDNAQRIRESTWEVVVSDDGYGVEGWASLRKYKPSHDVLRDKWTEKYCVLEKALVRARAMTDKLKLVNKMVLSYVDKIEKQTHMLVFGNKTVISQTAGGDGEDQQVEIQMQVEQEIVEEVVEEVQKIELEQFVDISFLSHGSDVPAVAVPLPAPALPISSSSLAVEGVSAYYFSFSWDDIRMAIPLGEYIRIELPEESINAPGWRGSAVEKEKYTAAKSFLPRELDTVFFVSQNFIITRELGQAPSPQGRIEPVFSRYLKDVKYLFLCWDTKSTVGSVMKCYFISAFDAETIRGMIETHRLTDCSLCTTDGVGIAQATLSSSLIKTGSVQLPTPPLQAFLTQCLALAHFFNADVEYMRMNADDIEIGLFRDLLKIPDDEAGVAVNSVDMTVEKGRKKKEKKVGMYAPSPTSPISRFLKNLRGFLLRRATASGYKLAAVKIFCRYSSLMLFGCTCDNLEHFLAHNGLHLLSPPSDIMKAILVQQPDEWAKFIYRLLNMKIILPTIIFDRQKNSTLWDMFEYKPVDNQLLGAIARRIKGAVAAESLPKNLKKFL